MKTSDQRIEHILRRMLADRSTDAPSDSIKWAKNFYRTRPMEQPAGIMQRIIAVVTANIAPGQLAFGERSSGAGQARQMLFEAGENAIDLRITESSGKFDVKGQILGNGFERSHITLAGDAAFTTETDESATFAIAGLPAGQYTLTIRGEAVELVVEQLMLK